MTTVAADALSSGRERTLSIAPALAVAALASIGAGAIHAAAIGVHSEHRQAVITFTVVAAIQIGFGVLALSFSSRIIAVLGALTNATFIGGWALAKTNGISFIDGLDVKENIQTADAIAAALAAVAIVGVVVALRAGLRPSALGGATLAIAALVTALIATPAMVSAGSHAHSAGDDHGGAAATDTHSDGHGDAHGDMPGGGGDPGNTPAAVPTPYDPTKPIDLSGVDGVTPEQQAQAENLIAVTLLRLPQFSDPATAEAAGYRSIGDGFTGYEHYINQALFDDGRILDPDYPESLVYQTNGTGGKQLVAAMFMLESDATLDDVPDYGGKLMQWHIHNNLCFTTSGQVAGLTNADGTCTAPLVTGVQSPMVHVWITPHECGPFAALEGVAGGQIKDGEERWCDHAHGAS
ncbi:MAG TPA: hypothetical protein VFZ83_00645 [Acidimicrobiia bacterium]|nr:hypothetical protein [Acidimicrobiia bacterium]